jgi:hypothetical protein
MRSRKSRRVKKPARAKRGTRTRESSRATKHVRTAKPARVEETALVPQSPRVNPGLGAWAVGIVVICVVTTALLLAVSLSSVERADEATIDPLDEVDAARLESLRASEVPTVDRRREDLAGQVQPAGVPKPSSRALAGLVPSTPSAPETAVKTMPLEAMPAVKATPLAETIEKQLNAELTASTRFENAPLVTVTGCLEADDETFRLKDTTGADVPTGRSWKTGFLKKRSASIEVVDAANRMRLTNHVGQRVTLTGTLVDREMQVRSLQRLAESCKR